MKSDRIVKDILTPRKSFGPRAARGQSDLRGVSDDIVGYIVGAWLWEHTRGRRQCVGDFVCANEMGFPTKYCVGRNKR